MRDTVYFTLPIAPQIAEICTVANSLPLFLKYSAKSLFFNRLNPTDENLK